MTKIYTVFIGDADDGNFRECGAFSTLERAQQRIDCLTKVAEWWETFKIHVWEIDNRYENCEEITIKKRNPSE